MEDIRNFKETNKLDRMVMIWCASTEIFLKQDPVHATIASLEKAMKENHPAIAPSMIYAYAALKSGIPFANGAPNLTVDIPAMRELARETGSPVAGKDFKTGQTLMKTILAPGLKARLLGLNGWFSTNILGNRDGEVLDDPESFKTKEESKLSVLEYILQPEVYPDLYGNYTHKVRINYYPPRGDNKEGWDNIDIFGWMGYPMQIKIDFLCRDSILAAPIVLDLVLFMDLAKRAGHEGHPGVALLLLQEPDVRARALPGARPLHPADEAQEHAPAPQGRGAHHPPGAGILRLTRAARPSQGLNTALAIWMSWTATPVRSATVISPSEARRSDGSMITAPSSTRRSFPIAPAPHGPERLAAMERLADAVHDDPVGGGQDRLVELLLFRGVRAHGRDVGPGPDVAAAEERFRGRGAGDDDVAGRRPLPRGRSSSRTRKPIGSMSAL